MQISAKELRQLAGDVDEVHRDSMRSFRADAVALHAEATSSRRSFLRGAGLAGVGGTVLATGGGLATLTRLGGVAGAQAAPEITDPILAGYSQSIELAVIDIYGQAIPKLTADAKPLAELFVTHHTDHAAAFGDLAGENVQTAGNKVLLKQMKPALTGLASQTTGPELDAAILEVAMKLENQAAYTYASAIGFMKDPHYSALTSTILPIEAQHAAVIAIALGAGPAAWFPTGAFESEEVGDGSDPLRGLDPGTFAV